MTVVVFPYVLQQHNPDCGSVCKQQQDKIENVTLALCL